MRSASHGIGTEIHKSIFKAAVWPLPNEHPYDSIIITCQKDKDPFRRNTSYHEA